MKILEEMKLDYSDVLIRPKRSILESRKDVDLNRTFKFKNGNTWTGVPIVSANMDTTGTIAMGKVLARHNMLTCLSKHGHRAEDWETLTYEEESNMALSFGIKDRDLLINDAFAKEFAYHWDFFCLDVANGYSQKFIDFVKEVRERWPEKIIIAGNVVTAEMTEALLLAGADIIKIGIGPGSVCTTRKVSGVGYPQLSAVIECAEAAHGLDGFIMGVNHRVMLQKPSVQEQTSLC